MRYWDAPIGYLVVNVTGEVGSPESGVAIHLEGADGVTTPGRILYIYGMHTSRICREEDPIFHSAHQLH
jgi:hypothetical protein